MSFGSASTLTSRVDLVEDAALRDAGGVVAADELDRDDRAWICFVEVDAQEVDVQRLAAHRVVLGVLEHDRRRRRRRSAARAPRRSACERVAQLARVDGEATASPSPP